MTGTEVLRRSFAAELAASGGDGRTIEGRAVPYNERALVVDPDGKRYVEGFVAGAFRRSTRAPQRLVLLYEHGSGILDVVGPAVALEERPDGLFGSWRAIDGAVGDQALSLVRAGVLTGLSVGFRPLGPGRRDDDGTLWRTACHLDEVSLTRSPAFAGAVVTAVRSLPDELAAPLERVERSSELDERLRALGLGSTSHDPDSGH
jgi:Escherichia/Staphylococcus phage prohead protease